LSKGIAVLSGVPKTFVEGIKNLGYKQLNLSRKRFPDGELYLRFLESVEKAYVLQSLYPEQDSKIIELYLAVEALKGLGASVDVVLLYAAYARQDKRFLSGEPISVRALYKPLAAIGCERLVVIDAHSPKAFSQLGIKFVNIIPHAYLARRANLSIDFVLAPDKGALHRAQELAREYGVPYDNLDKYRDRITGEITFADKKLDVRGMNVAIVDDIVSTGGTLVKATEALYKAGASKVIAVVTHALLVSNAVKKLEQSGLHTLVTANTIERSNRPKWLVEINVSELVAKEL